MTSYRLGGWGVKIVVVRPVQVYFSQIEPMEG